MPRNNVTSATGSPGPNFCASQRSLQLRERPRNPSLPCRVWHAWQRAGTRKLPRFVHRRVLSTPGGAANTRTTSSRRCRNLTALRYRYDEEKALLGFFTSALSAVESFYFCAYFAGWLVSPAFFKHVANPNRITVERAAQAFSKAFPSDPFPMQMASLQNDSQFREIEEVRNVLAHRVLPGRIRHLSVVIGGAAASAACMLRPLTLWSRILV